MQIKKSLLIAGAVTTLGLATTLGVGAYAMGGGGSGGSSELVTKIAQRFNLNQSDVQAVFDEYKNAEREAEISERLQELVDEGKITAEQKTLIENKLKEVQAARDQERRDLEAWAKEKNIDLKYVMGHGSKRLDKLVEQGKITAEQKTAIEAKRTELETKHKADREALKQWAKENGIDEKYLHMDGGGEGHHSKDNGRH
jgi:polyhydroxyalkanoate synthesis regulator phasin